MAVLETAGSFEALFKHWTEMLAFGIEIFAALVIGVAALQAAIRCVRVFLSRDESTEAWTLVRLRLGRWLALALEFELAADILGTAVAPTWDDIGKLAAIIVLRTMLNYFLQREVREADEQARRMGRIEQAADQPEPRPAPQPPGTAV